MSIQLFIILLYLGTNLFLTATSIPLMRGRVRRNGIYGLRVRKTLSSDAIWYPANRYFGEEMFKSGLVSTAGTLLLAPLYLLLGLTIDQVTVFGLLITTLPLGWTIVKSLFFLRRL
jgi:hypothetical protein